MLPYDQFRMMMSKLRFADDSALRSIGLAKLAKTYDAYPILEGGRRLYCLLPKGMDVSQACQLSVGAASQKIIVLQQGQRGYAKVWPLADAAAAAPQAVGEAATEPEGPVGDLEIVEE